MTRLLHLGACLAMCAPLTGGCTTSSHEPVAVRLTDGSGPARVTSGGDPYFPLDGNAGYDVRHYRIRDTYTPADDRLRGTTSLRAVATADLSRLSLDLVLPVDDVWVDGRPAHFRKPEGHELLVTPDHPVAEGDAFTVQVDYHGRPGSVRAEGDTPGSDLWFHQPDETIALGEPQNGAWWFAANETPQDKASFDITLQVPRGTEAVSGGALVSRQVADGWASWHWRVDRPVATYMVFFAAGQFVLDQGTTDGRPYVYAVSERLPLDQRRSALRRLGKTGGIVAWLESVLGPYPFGQIGGLVPGLPLGYALEDATRPVYPWSAGTRSQFQTYLVHELAHQWFGDDVALTRWRDVWLNEGFASYAEWWYSAAHGGDDVATRLDDTYGTYPADSPFWQVVVSDPGPARMWNEAVYVRGAMTLAALRNRVGDPDFARILRAWVSRHGGGNVSGDEFRSLAEEISGADLDAFFSSWLDEKGKPAETAENGL